MKKTKDARFVEFIKKNMKTSDKLNVIIEAFYPIFDKEGEINLEVLDNNKISLATITFIFLKLLLQNLFYFLEEFKELLKRLIKTI